jgi:hypothetical protein
MTYGVLWDEVVPTMAGSWPAGGTLLFLWPHLRGHHLRPAWTRRPGDDEDELGAWWNLEDRKVSAALLRPFYAELLAFLSARVGAARFELLEPPGSTRIVQRVRALLGGTAPGLTPPDQLAALVEGAAPAERKAGTITFGTPVSAILHGRRDECCLWLWLETPVVADFERFLAAGAGAPFHRCDMDWSGTGAGSPAPRPPPAPAGPPRLRWLPSL